MSTTILGKEVFTTLEEKLRPAHTALLVVDVQNDFCSPGGALETRGGDIGRAQAILEPLRGLSERARTAGVKIVNIKMTLHSDGRTNSPADLARRLRLWSGVPMATLTDTWGHANADALLFQDEDWVVHKCRNNAFVGTNLDVLLRGRGVHTVVVTGLATEACVLEAALMAQSMDYYVVVPTDCVGSSSEELHQNGLAVLGAVLHHEGLTNSDRIREVWGG